MSQEDFWRKGVADALVLAREAGELDDDQLECCLRKTVTDPMYNFVLYSNLGRKDFRGFAVGLLMMLRREDEVPGTLTPRELVNSLATAIQLLHKPLLYRSGPYSREFQDALTSPGFFERIQRLQNAIAQEEADKRSADHNLSELGHYQAERSLLEKMHWAMQPELQQQSPLVPPGMTFCLEQPSGADRNQPSLALYKRNSELQGPLTKDQTIAVVRMSASLADETGRPEMSAEFADGLGKILLLPRREAVLRPGHAVKVCTLDGSTEGHFQVVQALSSASIFGGVYKVLGLDRARSGRSFVLKHNEAPIVLERRHQLGFDCLDSHQVLREREALLALQGAGWPHLPRMHLAGCLQLPADAPASQLSGASAILTELAGRPLLLGATMPVLSPGDLVALAYCGVSAICELRATDMWHNDMCPRNITIQALATERSPPVYTFVDMGCCSCPRLDTGSRRAQLHAPIMCPPSIYSPACDLWFSSVEALGAHALSPTSDLQSLAHTLLALSGAALPWETAAEVGDREEAMQLRLALIHNRRGARDVLQSLPPVLASFVTWVLDQAQGHPLDIGCLHSWRLVLQETASKLPAG